MSLNTQMFSIHDPLFYKHVPHATRPLTGALLAHETNGHTVQSFMPGPT